MAKSKKTAPARPDALQGRKNHPVHSLLDLYEANAKAKGSGASEKIEKVLTTIPRVRRFIEKNDAEGAAFLMWELALFIERAGFSLHGKKRAGFVKDRRWLEAAIREAMRKRPDANRTALWKFFKVYRNSPDNALEVDGRGYAGSVHWEKAEIDGCLIFDDKGDGDSINFDTFKKAVSLLKK